jgi:hypothetical protein
MPIITMGFYLQTLDKSLDPPSPQHSGRENNKVLWFLERYHKKGVGETIFPYDIHKKANVYYTHVCRYRMQI